MEKSEVCIVRANAFTVFACMQLERRQVLEDCFGFCLGVFPLCYEGRSRALGRELFVDVGRFHR